MDTPEVKMDVAGDPAVEAVTSPSDDQALETARIEMAALRAERNDLKDIAQRTRAEFENYRRRVEREKAEMMDLGATDAVRQILAVVDDLSRALKTETQDKEYARGIELIHQRFTETLKKLGLTPIETEGRVFDPNQHYAVEMAPNSEVEDQTILAEYQKGYMFKGKLLRPAMVKVAVRK